MVVKELGACWKCARAVTKGLQRTSTELLHYHHGPFVTAPVHFQHAPSSFTTITVPSSLFQCQLLFQSRCLACATRDFILPCQLLSQSRCLACASRDFILPCQLLSQSRCLACASRAFVLPYSLPHRMSIKIRVHQNTSSYRRVHQNTSSIATQDRIARRLPYARTQSSGPITALKLIKNCRSRPLVTLFPVPF